MPKIPTTKSSKPNSQSIKQPSIWQLLSAYKWQVTLLLIFTLVASGLNLIIPKLIADSIDAFTAGTFEIGQVAPIFIGSAIIILVASYLQSLVQTYTSEQVGRDLREKLIGKISKQSFAYIQQTSSATLLTNLTTDVDAIKMFVAQAIAAMISSVFIIIGASVLLISIDWQLAIAVLLVLPMIGGLFAFVLGKVRTKFLEGQKIIDRLNQVINESILGSALIRVLHSQAFEYQKFLQANSEARNIGMQILGLFATLIPIIGALANLASLLILVLGGHFVIINQMSLGDLTAFNSYLTMLIFPLFILGFMSGVMARATASFQRLLSVLDAPEPKSPGTLTTAISGKITVKHLGLSYDKKEVFKDISFEVAAGSKLAIIGPTGEGKTQLLYLLTGLTPPTKGQVFFDTHTLEEYEPQALHQQIGLVFQDSIMFNLTIRENIAFSTTVTDADLTTAIETAELKSFIEKLPRGLDTVVSERGTSLSGGQKQRMMLARALALNPKILLLDDFTARVDTVTERKIVANIAKNYPDLTLISVTQKISSVKDYDQIILLMDGEVLAKGTHTELMKTSPEYAQIYSSQKSTSHYELLAE